MPSPSPEALALGEHFRLDADYDPQRGAAGERLARATGSSLEFQDRRVYQAGDDVRHLDWRAYARTDQLFVRQYREEILPRLELMLDVSCSMAVSEEKAQASVDLLWVLLAAARGGGFEVSTIALGDRALLLEDERILRAGVEFDSRQTLEGALREARGLLRPGTLRILLSDFLTPHRPHALVRLATQRAGRAVLLQLLDSVDAEPPVDAALRLTDCETGAELDLVVDERTRGRYLERLGRLRGGLERECVGVGARFLSMRADVPLRESCRDPLAREGVLAPC